MPGIVPPATLEQIRAASDLVEIIGTSVPLKRVGANFRGLCPFHKEKTPSFYVSAHKQIFHCYGCNKSGDVFTWIREYEGVGFMEAVQRLAERARIPLELSQEPGAEQRRFVKDALLSLHEQITKRWQQCLLHDAAGEAARAYLQQRGVTADAIQRFRLGFAPDAWDDTLHWAKSKGFEISLVEQAGLIVKREGADGYYDRFRGRLMFPIADEQGRIIAFSGRLLDPEAKAAKYVNSPETPIFTKGRVFYGLDKSKRAILDAKQAILCEGQIDLIACHTAGVTNVVAPQGTAFTSDHARILRRYTEEVVLCFDGDSAGQNAAVKALDPMLAVGLAARVAVVPSPHDPDSFIKAFGAAAFRELIAKAEGFFDFLLRRLLSLHASQGDRGRLAIVRAMGEAVRKTGSAVLIDTYAQKTAQALAVSAEAVRMEFRKQAPFASRATAEDEDPAAEPEAAETESEPNASESRFLALLFSHPELIPYARAHGRLDWFEHRGLRAVVERILQDEPSGGAGGASSFLDQVPSGSLRVLLSRAAMESQATKNPALELQMSLGRIRDRFAKSKRSELNRKLGEINANSAEHQQIIAKLKALQSLLATPLPKPGP